MFDDIIVPKAYLRNLLRKEYEKLLDTKHLFQTKDLDNVLDVYKIHKQQLYRLDRSEFLLKEEVQHTKLTEKWIKVNNDSEVNFYSNAQDAEDNEYWFEFKFTFKNGKIDKKELVECELQTSKEERDSINAMWDTEQKIFDNYRGNSFSYRLFSWLERHLQKMTNWARNKHQLPFELRKMAYKKSGRLKKDPDALKIYKDV